MFFWNILKTAFNWYSIPYSFYLAFGFCLSQLLNIQVYEAKGATSLRTWFKGLGMLDFNPSVKLVKILCFVMAVIIFFLFQFMIPEMRQFSGERILNTGILVSFILIMISQLIFSSIMRLSYEFSFCLIIFTSIIVYQVFIQPIGGKLEGNLTAYQELWDVLKILIPVCIGFPILMGGGGLIASFYKEEQEFLRTQLYRHIAMALYFEIGAAFFLLLPIMKKILSLRGNI